MKYILSIQVIVKERKGKEGERIFYVGAVRPAYLIKSVPTGAVEHDFGRDITYVVQDWENRHFLGRIDGWDAVLDRVQEWADRHDHLDGIFLG